MGNRRGIVQTRTGKLKKEVRAAEKAWIDAAVADVNGLHRRSNGGDGRQLSPKLIGDTWVLLCKRSV